VKLYKYRKFNEWTIDGLINSSHYFASPIELNDPLDCQICTKNIIDDAIAMLHQNYMRTSPENEKIPALIENLKMIKDHYMKPVDEAYGRLIKIGVLSLSKVSPNEPDSILMWSHYTQDHTGLCLEFEMDEDNISLESEVEWHECLYDDSNPIIRLLINYPYATIGDINGELDLHGVFEFAKGVDLVSVMTKSKPWEYEKEVRLVNPKKGPLKYWTSSLKTVTFGMKRAKAHKKAIMLMLSTKEYEHVKFKQITRSNLIFGFQSNPCSLDCI